MTLAEQTKQYWSAVYYIRRAPDRDHTQARAVLFQLLAQSGGRLYVRVSVFWESLI